jgi:hypothetical protein
MSRANERFLAALRKVYPAGALHRVSQASAARVASASGVDVSHPVLVAANNVLNLHG